VVLVSDDRRAMPICDLSALEPAPDQWIHGIGSVEGPGGAPRGYRKRLWSAVERMAESPDWQAWWQGCGEKNVEVLVYVATRSSVNDDWLPRSLRTEGAVSVRRTKGCVSVTIRAVVLGRSASMDEVAEWARQDLLRVVAKLRQRFALGEPPQLEPVGAKELQARAERRSRNAG
jgi:hypothetical protein